MVSINKTSSKPYYEQLMLSIKQEILQGVLVAGDKLPSVRELARDLMMNPNTISKAYKLLENEQVLITVKGKGTFVKKSDSTQRDDFRIQMLKGKLKDLFIEAGHLQVTHEELVEWIQESEEMWGMKNED
ncbi:GntR family transcriptional regulator [Enterococcus sp. JM4C]|uniref:GntR family transcriptional regulator n=1 Tax=Candidatus Enterococcus huntleyi TaxID=1857217 RepID=UPI00137A79FF|nr:GntR family transcriptional regulator [Enterococcus sp. JM4C]KAF1297567.1 GntR family transcriptional regulator [Enterococcus sp. JM4C]